MTGEGTASRRGVLIVAPWAPYPFDGGSKRLYTLCRLLRDRFRFTLLTFRPSEPPDGPRGVAEELAREARWMAPVFEEIHWVERSRAVPPERVDGLWLPDDVRRFYSDAMAERVSALSVRADLTHIEFDLMAPYVRSVRGTPTLFTQHDVGTMSFFQSYFREMAGWGKFRNVVPWIRRVAYQARVGRLFDRVVVMTEADKKRLSRIVPPRAIRAVPTGVDLDYFAPRRTQPEAPVLAYLGHYPHYPNEDAVLYFCREILPRIRERVPEARFVAAGSSPTPAVRRLAEEIPGVAVPGTVEDVRPLLAGAAVFVAPLRLGQGIKGKVLEAFAMGVPVVATSRAADGLDVAPGRDLWVADGAAPFADAVARLLRSSEARTGLGAAGLAAVRARYDWRVRAAHLADVYGELLGTRAAVAA